MDANICWLQCMVALPTVLWLFPLFTYSKGSASLKVGMSLGVVCYGIHISHPAPLKEDKKDHPVSSRYYLNNFFKNKFSYYVRF